jgi:methylenetetrahydrofolate reductase (NADPH)
VAREVGEEKYAVTGLHIFTFNQVAETEAWRQRLLADL